MATLRIVLTVLALGLMLSACQSGTLVKSEIDNRFNIPTDNLVTGGPPSKNELSQLKVAGITKVIDLRSPDEERAFDERAEAQRLGLEYLSLPVAGAGGVTRENARELDQLLQGGEKVFLHCASGNRVGALLAIRAHEVEGKSLEQSLEFGRAAGLGSLEEKVKTVLSE